VFELDDEVYEEVAEDWSVVLDDRAEVDIPLEDRAEVDIPLED